MKYNNQYYSLIILAILFLLTFLSTYNDIAYIFYMIVFEGFLISLILTSTSNKIALLLSLSTFIYFYQVPFIDYFPQEKLGRYAFNLEESEKLELFFVYDFVFFGLLFIIKIVATQIHLDKIINEINKKREIYLSLYQSAFLICILLIIYTIISNDGILNYISLNKFEASESQKLVFFTFKDFGIIAITIGLILKGRYVKYSTYMLILILISFEILSAKRFIILMIFTLIFIFKFKEFKKIHFAYIITSIMLMSLIKMIYYPIRLYASGDIEFLDIFWFTWFDFFNDAILIHETRAHIELLANFISLNWELDYTYIAKQLMVSVPFGHNIIDDYKSAGELMKEHLNEPWSGLSSSQYIIPYLSLGFLGILLIYAIQAYLVYFLYKLTPKSNLLKLTFLSNIPIIFFYSHREEIIVIIKNIIILFSAVVITYCFSILIRIITMKISFQRNKFRV